VVLAITAALRYYVMFIESVFAGTAEDYFENLSGFPQRLGKHSALE